MIQLVRPTEAMKEQAIEFRQEFFEHGEFVINGSELFDKTDDYTEWCKSIDANTKEETVNPNWVITDTFFAMDAQDRIVGIIDFRHTLNDFLKDLGHCGYSVRPSERRKGFATEMLRQLLEVAQKTGMNELYLSVERKNEPSVKTIIRNGGVYERSFEIDGEQADIYRIALSKLTGGEPEMNIYYIGGSPCAGKSSVAEILSKKHDLYYFKADDFLDRYMQTGAKKGYSICRKVTSMNAEQVWMREPIIQCREEFDIYREIFEFVATDLKQIDWNGGIITEGAVYFPKLMKQSGISGSRYISITPVKEFQITHYRERDFVPLVLEGCSDKEKAFRNWMDRDVLFAQEVQRQCQKENYVSVINDGTMEMDELVNLVAVHFGLK